MLPLRIMVNLSLLALAYYVGKRIGQTKPIQREMERWRSQQAQEKEVSDQAAFATK